MMRTSLIWISIINVEDGYQATTLFGYGRILHGSDDGGSSQFLMNVIIFMVQSVAVYSLICFSSLIIVGIASHCIYGMCHITSTVFAACTALLQEVLWVMSVLLPLMPGVFMVLLCHCGNF